MRMKRALAVAALSVGLIVGLASADDKDNDETFRVEPFQVGLGSLAGWIRGAGEPGQKNDDRQFGLYLQKNTKTTNFSSAGAELTGNIPKTVSGLTTLAFDIPGVVGVPFQTFDPSSGSGANGYCNNGAPRFNVFSRVGTGPLAVCFLGCPFGRRTQDPVTGWWTIKFEAPFNEARFPGCGTPTGNLAFLELIFDEGIDVGGTVGNSPGNVVLDNIRVNDQVVGKPKDDD